MGHYVFDVLQDMDLAVDQSDFGTYFSNLTCHSGTQFLQR